MLTTEARSDLVETGEVLVSLPDELRGKAEGVLAEVKGFRGVMVAFSGGVDSSTVALLAKIALGEKAVAVTAISPSLSEHELREAQRIASQIGIRHMTIETKELENPDYKSNPANRCYFCKKELSLKLRGLARELGFEIILDGTNADDLKQHRPGAAALKENGILSPLAEANITKDEVRELAKRFGLSNFNKPSTPCLSSRIQYGQVITPERLRRIEESENLIRSLTGARWLRVRDHGTLARIELGRDVRHLLFNEELLDNIGDALIKLGFTYVTFDLLGYRSGSMNEIKRQPIPIDVPPAL